MVWMCFKEVFSKSDTTSPTYYYTARPKDSKTNIDINHIVDTEIYKYSDYNSWSLVLPTNHKAELIGEWYMASKCVKLDVEMFCDHESSQMVKFELDDSIALFSSFVVDHDVNRIRPTNPIFTMKKNTHQCTRNRFLQCFDSYSDNKTTVVKVFERVLNLEGSHVEEKYYSYDPQKIYVKKTTKNSG